jgi:succinate dehydrogenase / fumarate reductase cytochrome b subunit
MVKSSIGKKVVMSGTGILLFGFVVAHLIGNLQMFLGQEVFNKYAAFLQSMPGPLWVARIVLLIAFVAHVVTAIQLKKINSDARPVKYLVNKTVQASVASRYMLLSGILILFFVLFHLAHLTFGIIHPEYAHLTDSKGQHDVFSFAVLSFQNPLTTATYTGLMIVLAMHLSHGIASVFQTLGLNHGKYTPCINKISPIIGWGIALLYMSIPVSVYFGMISTSVGR